MIYRSRLVFSLLRLASDKMMDAAVFEVQTSGADGVGSVSFEDVLIVSCCVLLIRLIGCCWADSGVKDCGWE